MNDEERYKIIDNNYADLLIDERIINDIQTIYTDASFNRINQRYSIAYIPAEDLSSNIIYSFGYEIIPKCYGLMSITGYESLERAQLNYTPDIDYTGEGVLVGFIDTGIDYMNPAFQYEDNSSRIVSIWDQTIESENEYPEGFYYGTEYRREQIDTALRNSNPLSIVPSIDEIGHGTRLAGIAGGSYNSDNGFIGVSPNVEFAVVKLKPAKAYLKDFFFIPEDALCYQENDIMLGINYLVQIARELKRPIAICLGLGSSQGAHHGDGIFNNFLSDMGNQIGISFIVAAGNEGAMGRHYFGEITPTIGYNDVELNIGNEIGFFMEFWGNGPNLFSVDIFSPTGEFIGRVPTFLVQRTTIQFEYINTILNVDNTLSESSLGDQFILFRFRNPQSGTWRFRVYGVGDILSSFHIWLPINDWISQDTYFVDSNPYTTITAPGNEATVLTVTAYDSESLNLYYNASKGFTKNNRPKPDIAAPGVNILAPIINNQYAWSTGTSVAAAYTTGIVAMLFEWGIIRENYPSISSAKIRIMLASGAYRFPDILYPNPDWGFGILDFNNSIIVARRE
ncbi:subtilase family protein [Mobilisporobacter senegalensis]|uniref:Subtilase family protein n=1 Tax=Mobilisporobacter senegalensis TaxID=1329262 RepID=A0A3N1XR64_9FIRM|nr:S8 family peptidase [Mobilisporobacter senegalensis]ROR27287.1 subtilase family protein [Mobilisporobacter senegalensis]